MNAIESNQELAIHNALEELMQEHATKKVVAAIKALRKELRIINEQKALLGV